MFDVTQGNGSKVGLLLGVHAPLVRHLVRDREGHEARGRVILSLASPVSAMYNAREALGSEL
jgi:hypothetical protein